MRIILLSILLVTVSTTASQVCNYEESVELTNRTFNGTPFDDGEFFFDNKTGDERGCICLKQTCARKCCPFGQFYNNVDFKCEDSVQKFNPPVWKDGVEKQGFNFREDFHVLIDPKNLIFCNANESKALIGQVVDFFHLRTDGTLYALQNDYKFGIIEFHYGPNKYCIDNMPDPDNSSDLKPDIITCLLKTKANNEIHLIVKACCMVISCFFIILTVAVYGFLPEFRTTIHGKVMLAYLSSFFFGLLTLATMLFLLHFDQMPRKTCTILTFIIYYFLLAAFFWLNVMSYDIYRKFKKMSIHRDSSKRFYWYCAYAFGVPVAFTILLAGLQFSNLPKKSFFAPKLEQGHCFMNGLTRQLYLFLPTLILIAANLVFFLLVARKLIKTRKETERLGKKHTRQFGLYVKLFIVAGISWIFDLISDLYPKLDNFWIITDVYNILVGLMIFIIFVCKKKVFLSLQENFKQLRSNQSQRNGLRNRPTPATSIAPPTPVTQSLETMQMDSIDSGLDKKL